jgi:ribosome biogenesis GTPase
MNDHGDADSPARVIESFGRRVIVECADGARLPAELFGKRLNCVCGDEVSVRRPLADRQGDTAKVTSVAARRTHFARTDSRGRTESLASNLSLIAVLLAPQPLSDPYVADRYLAGAAFAGIKGMIVANKADLASTRDPQFRALLDEYRRASYSVIELSAQDSHTLGDIKAALRSEVTMLVGQSGVGKSTLTNALVAQSSRATRALSDATGEGRHTTVSTALFRIDGGGELIDSPGVRDYAPPLIEDAQVQAGWPEILALAPHCRFNNCLHLREPGCAVTGAVTSGSLAARRYESYKRLLNIMRGLAPEYERRR